MRRINVVLMRPVMGHQQPARKAGFNHVKAGACRGLRKLSHHHIEITLEQDL